MNCLLGNKFINSGSIKINSLNPGNQKLKEFLNILSQENVVPEKLKVKELLDFIQKLYKNPLTNEEIMRRNAQNTGSSNQQQRPQNLNQRQGVPPVRPRNSQQSARTGSPGGPRRPLGPNRISNPNSKKNNKTLWMKILNK